MEDHVTWTHNVPPGGKTDTRIIFVNGEALMEVTAYEPDGGGEPIPDECPDNMALPLNDGEWFAQGDSGDMVVFRSWVDPDDGQTWVLEATAGGEVEVGRYRNPTHIPVVGGEELRLAVTMGGSFEAGEPMATVKFWAPGIGLVGQEYTGSISPGEVPWTRSELAGIIVPDEAVNAELEYVVSGNLQGIVEFKDLCLSRTEATYPVDRATAIAEAAAEAQVMEFNTKAALQLAIHAAGTLWPNSEEFPVVDGEVLTCQRAENPETGEVFVYFAEDGDWQNIQVIQIHP